MARTTAANNANTTYSGQGTTAVNNENADINQYNANETKLTNGGSVGANPFTSSAYLSNVNKLQSESLDNANNTTQANMRRSTIATGGINGSQALLAERDAGLQTGRLADTLSAQRAASDYKSNLAWQQYLAQAPLNAASAEQGIYSTATGGQGNALNNLTNLSGQQYGFWGGLAGSAMAGAGMGLAHTCWIAMALYGDDDPRTHLLRSWLNDEFQQHAFGRATLKLYRRLGERIGRAIRRFRPLGWVFRPLFEAGLIWARHDRRQLPREAF